MSRKKSVEQHIADGTYRPSVHGPRPEEVRTAGTGKPKKPKASKEAEAAWAELAKLVGARLQAEDGPQLEQAAVWLAKWRLIVAKLDQADPGTLAFARLVSAASTASKNFDRIARKFGLTPLDRESLSVDTVASHGVRKW
jgi:hypothetical protein